MEPNDNSKGERMKLFIPAQDHIKKYSSAINRSQIIINAKGFFLSIKRFLFSWIWPQIIISILVGFIVIFQNMPLFSSHTYYIRDYAMSSIGSYQASAFNRIYGIPSLTQGYYYPGASWLYIVAFFETILNIFSLPAIIPSFLLAQISIVVISFILSAFMFYKTAHDKYISLLCFILFVAWVIASPKFLSEPWDIHISAVAYLSYVSLFIISLVTKDVKIGFFSGLWGSLSVQIYSGTIFAVVFTSSVYLYYYITNHREYLRIFAGHIIGAILLAWPVFLDFILYNGANYHAIRNWSSQQRNLEKLDISAMFNLVKQNCFPSRKHYLIFLIIIAVGILVCMYRKTNFQNRPLVNSRKKYLPIILSLIGILSGFFVYRFIVTKAYPAPHIGAYIYLSFGLFLSSFIGLLYSFYRSKFIKVLSFCLSFILLICIIISTPFGLKDWGGLVYSPGLTDAVREIESKYNRVNFKIELNEAVQPDREIYELELLWGYPTGLASVLLRKGVDYRMMPLPDNVWLKMVFPWIIETSICDAADENPAVVFYWKDQKLFLETPDNCYELTNY
jgi:hypothetical protein